VNKNKIIADTQENIPALKIDPPGVNYGPCCDPCAHRDCTWQRETAARACCLCKKPVGFGRLFYEHEGDVAHQDCLEERINDALPSPTTVH
jgi:hypothetical protein